MRNRCVVALMAACAFGAPRAALATTFQLVNADGAGEGLNDPTPVAPVGGNPATTLGAARQRVLTEVFAAVGCHIDSVVAIQVNVAFDALSCTATSGTLGSAGAAVASKNFPNAPRANFLYAIALANSLAQTDLDTQNPDVIMRLNASVGASGCLTGSFWYLGLDGAASSTNFDLYTIVMHELMHGLGFHTYVDPTTGAKLTGNDDVFEINFTNTGATPSSYSAMTDAQRAIANTSEPNLLFSGQNLVTTYGSAAAMYAPATLSGSSLNHFSLQQLQSELMNPAYLNPNHAMGRAISVFKDEGWSAHTACIVPHVSATTDWSLIAFTLCMTVGGLTALLRRERACGDSP